MTKSLRTWLRHWGVAAKVALATLTSVSNAGTPCAGAWDVSAIPSARADHHLAHDAARGVSVLFGGQEYTGTLLNDTWTWDGQRWRQMAPAQSPTPRVQGAMAYDALRQRVVLFGGQIIGGVKTRETWEWDGATWTLRSNTGPSARFGHTMVYDSSIQRVVVFGGQDNANFQGDSWSWDGGAGVWTQIATTVTIGQGSVIGHQHMSSYDSARLRHVLFSVQGGAVTWERAGSVWSLISNQGPPIGPAGRSRGAMVFDASLGASVLFGGGGGGASDASVWAWNGASWSVAQPALPTGPTAREGHAMSRDTGRGVMVLFGGSTPGGGVASSNNETWEWSQATGWRNLTTPSPRESHAIAYDPALREIVLFGGIVSAGGTVSQETWTRSETGWTRRLTSAPPGMGGRYAHSMVYDERAQRVVLFGGRLQGGGLAGAGMWEWNGAQWTQRSSAQVPGARANLAMVYARGALGQGRTVLAGGVVSNGSASSDTWAWDGATGQWQGVGSLPTTMSSHAMAYDSRDNVIVAFGGRTSAGTPPSISQHRTLYRLDANLLGWTQLLPGAGTWPLARERHAMVFDGSSNTTVMIGGIADDQNAGVLYSDVWEWDNRLQTWSLRAASGDAPPGIRRHAVTADTHRSEIVVFGGALSANTSGGGIASGHTQSEWVFASPRISRWRTFAGGNYSNALNWECDRLPGIESTLVVERAGFNPALPGGTPAWPVNINVGTAQAARTMDVRWDSVTLNLLQSLSMMAPNDLQDPSLIVGGSSGEIGVLRLINSNVSGATTTFGTTAGILGRDAGSMGTLTASGQRVRFSSTGDLVIGRDGVGEARVEDRAQMVFGGGGTSLVVGERGQGTLRVTGPGARAQSSKGLGASSAIVAGSDAGSSGLVQVLSGGVFQADVDDFVVGDAGSGVVEVSGGNALLQTNSFNSAIVGRLAGSSGVVRVSASEWREGVSVPTVGLGGSGRVEMSQSAVVGDRGVSVASRGEVAGDGTIVGDVFNLGNVWPDPALGVGSATRGRIDVMGDYRQIGLPPGGASGAESGRLTIDLSGSGAGETSVLSATGSAQLAGALRVRLQSGFLPQAGYTTTVLTGATRAGTTFDVAFLPGFPDDRFMRVVYGGPSDNALVSLEVGSLAPRLAVPGAQAATAPAELNGAVGADINGDDLDDAVLIAPGNPGALIILFSRGVDGGGEFLGFGSALQYSVGNNPVGVVAKELDGQPGVDIAVADANGTLRVFTNNDDWQTDTDGVTGSFTARPLMTGLGDLSAMAGGDLNEDALNDLVVASETGGTLTVLRGIGGGDFSAGAPIMLGSSSSPRGIDIGDLDDDKDLRRPGMAVGGGGGLKDGPEGVAGRIFVLENVTATAGGPITFAPPMEFGVRGEVREVSIRNLNPASSEDRFGEVVAVVQDVGVASVVVLRNQGSTSGVMLSPPVALEIGSEATSVASVDLDGDDDPDLAVAAKPDAGSDRRVRVLRSEVSQGSLLAFSQAPDLPNPASAPAPALVRAWDISGDGRNDLVAIRPTASGSPGDGPALPSIAVRVNRVIDGDANRDGVIDFLDLNLVLSFFGQAGAALGGDVNGDGRVDFLDLNVVLSNFGQMAG